MIDVQSIKDCVDIVDVVSATVKLRRSGKNYMGNCPFHLNTHTPALAVFPETQTWRCFGLCADGGDVIKFVMKRDGIDFVAACRLLDPDMGKGQTRRSAPTSAPIRHVRADLHVCPDEPPSEQWQARGWQLIERAKKVLWSTDGEEGLRYLHEERLLINDNIERWFFGYIPHDCYMPFSVWGLPNNPKQPRGLWLPRGIVIPTFTEDGTLWGIHIRRNDRREGWKVTNKKLPFVSGSKKALWGTQNTARRVVTLTGGELDAALAEQTAYVYSGFCSLTTGEGSTLSSYWINYLMLADLIIGAYDSDDAGQSGAWEKIYSTTSRAVIEPPPELVEGSKDITDFARAGGNIATWIGNVRAKHLADDADLLAKRIARLGAMRSTHFDYWCDLKYDYEAACESRGLQPISFSVTS